MHPAIIGTVRSLIVDVAMGQIPRSTERISSFWYFQITMCCRNASCPVALVESAHIWVHVSCMSTSFGWESKGRYGSFR